MRDTLSRFEARVERLVEGTLTRWFGSQLSAKEILVHLARAMEDQAEHGSGGVLVAPTAFSVRMNPVDARTYLDGDPRVFADMQTGLVELARDMGLLLLKPPVVTIEPDEGVPSHGLMVTAHHEGAGDTQSMTPPSGSTALPVELPKGAYLIVDGNKHIPLDRPMISIGRRLSNQIVLDDPQVSRAHAQLRLRFGRFYVYDLGSAAGTKVNDRPVAEWHLRPGDVITIAGTRLIYAEEDWTAPADDASGHTQPMAPSPGEASGVRPGG